MNEQTIQLTQSEKIGLGTKEIAKRIRNTLKEKYPNCKFSVRCEYYSGGSSISISLMKSDFKVIKEFKDIPKEALDDFEQRRNSSKEIIQREQNKKYHQLNRYTLRGDFNPLNWCNGVFLTEEGHNLFKDVVEISDQYNYDNSDSQIDYFDVNFYLHLGIGKWNKEFEEVNKCIDEFDLESKGWSKVEVI